MLYGKLACIARFVQLPLRVSHSAESISAGFFRSIGNPHQCRRAVVRRYDDRRRFILE
jgi:hypothetical protein